MNADFESGSGAVLTGRSEGFVCGRPDIDETIRWLRAYADGGTFSRFEQLPNVDALFRER